MKIAITGHTQGIGKAIANRFSQTHDVQGYSRSNGYDISNPDTITRIIEDSKDCVIFINNAYDSTGQVELLNGLIDAHAGTNKLIINISSKLSMFPLGHGFDEYTIAKAKQNKVIKNRIFNDSPRVLNVITGLVDTNMSVKFDAPKLNPNDVANLIYTLTQYHGIVSVQEITIDVPGLDWKDIKQHVE